MAIIYSYPTSTPASGDLLIGTDITGNSTQNFTVGSVVTAGISTHITGTVNKIPLFTSANVIGDSSITQSASKIGIGTATPGSKLDVNGNITSTYNAADTNTGAYGVSRTLSGLTVNARGYRDDTVITAPGNNTVSYAGIDLKSQSTNGTYGHVTMLQGRHSLDAANLTDFEGLYVGGLNFTNSSSATNYVGVTVENPTLFNGSITNFIGTNIKAPVRTGGAITNFYGLKIEDNVSATNKWSVYSEDTSVKSKMLGQLESGDISVYNTGTSGSLNLNSSSTASGGNYIHAKKSNGSNQWVLGSNNANDDRLTLKQYNAANIIFANNSGDAMVIDTNGNVGIGTTSPSAKLSVSGKATVNELEVAGASVAGSQLTSLATKTSTGTEVNTWIDMTATPTSNATGDAYGAVIRAIGSGSNTDRGLIGINPVGRQSGIGGAQYAYGVLATGEQTGSGNIDFIIGVSSRASSSGNGTATTDYIRGVDADAIVNNANATVDYLQGIHAAANLIAGTVGEVNVNLLDWDYTAGTVTGDLSYIRIQNDNYSAVGGTARAIHSLAALPSLFSGTVEVAGGDLEASTVAKGLVLKSPDGTRYRVTVANGGTLSVSAV